MQKEGVSKLKQNWAFSPHYLHFDTPSLCNQAISNFLYSSITIS